MLLSNKMRLIASYGQGRQAGTPSAHTRRASLAVYSEEGAGEASLRNRLESNCQMKEPTGGVWSAAGRSLRKAQGSLSRSG